MPHGTGMLSATVPATRGSIGAAGSVEVSLADGDAADVVAEGPAGLEGAGAGEGSAGVESSPAHPASAMAAPP